MINENGHRKTITKLEAAVKQLVNKSASGDLAALRQLVALVSSGEQRSADAQAQRRTPLNEEDQKVMEHFLRRLEESKTGE